MTPSLESPISPGKSGSPFLPVGELREQRIVHISRDFYATMDSQLSVFCDDTLELLSDNDKYWWLVRDPGSGQTGYIPSEIIMTPHEHEAKLNRNKNQELTRIRSTDLEKASDECHSSFDEQPTENSSYPEEEGKEQAEESGQLWSRSGFARKGASVRSAPAVTRHKKTVSFSERKPIEHHFTVEDSISSTSSEGDSVQQTGNLLVDGEGAYQTPEEALTPSPICFYGQNIDPIVEELLEREFGKPELMTPQGPSTLEISSAAPAPQSNVLGVRRLTPLEYKKVEMDTFDDMKEIIAAGEGAEKGFTIGALTSTIVKKPASKLKKCIGKIWKTQDGTRSINRPHYGIMQQGQLLKIYAGNFSSVQGYKTMLIEEEATMAEVADRAVEKFGLNGDRFNYMLSIVHYESHEILQVSAAHTLGMVIELAKRATLMEGDFAPQTNASMGKLSRRMRKQQSRTMRMCKTAVGYANSNSSSGLNAFSCIASPVVQALGEAELERSPESDFVTHYKFVLNRWLDGLAPNAPFYLRVQMQLSHYGRPSSSTPGVVLNDKLGFLSSTRPPSSKTPRSPLSQSSALPTGLQNLTDDVKLQGNVKMLVNTSMSVAELCRAALASLDISAQVPGVKYDLFLSSSSSSSSSSNSSTSSGNVNGANSNAGKGGSRDRIYLSKDMTVQDILHLRPMIDPSGLVIVLQPVVDTYGKSHRP